LYGVAKKGGAEIDRGGRWHVIKYCRRDAATTRNTAVINMGPGSESRPGLRMVGHTRSKGRGSSKVYPRDMKRVLL
jgi:hypothetical protein